MIWNSTSRRIKYGINSSGKPKKTGFPRIEYGAGLVKPGTTIQGLILLYR
jgi:hypothetical protein